MVSSYFLELGYLLVPAVTFAIQAWLAYWVYTNRRGKRGTRAFLVMVVVGMVWMVSVMAHVVFDGQRFQEATYALWGITAYVSISAFVVFGSQYTGRDFHRHPFVALPLAFISVGYPLLILTNQYHSLVWTGFTPFSEPFSYLAVQPGPIIAVTTLLLTLLGLYTEFAMGKYLLSTSRRSGWQLVLLILGALPVTVLEYLSYTGLFPAAYMSHAPYGIIVFYGFTAVALFQFNLFDLKPVARNAIVEELGDPVFVVDTDGNLVDYNSETRALWPDIDDHEGDPFDVACPELAAVVDVGDPGVAQSERVTLARNGQERHYSTMVSRIEHDRDAAGDLYAVLLRDVTALERSRWQLERQNERLDQVGATISHDLRNPIQIADGRIGLIEEEVERDVDDEDVRASLRSHVESATYAIERMDTIIDDVLTIAREGKTVEETEPVTLSVVARDAWGTVETTDATLELDGDRTIEASESRLRSILENCYRNSLEHGPADATITVGASEDGFYVRDDGPGIPPGEVDRVFQTGYTTSDEGTGLGLAIVQTMAESHGWTVALDETFEDGAKLVFSGVDVDVQPEDPNSAQWVGTD